MVPTMFRQLLALPHERRRAFRAPALRAVLHGGEPCPQHVKRQMMDWLGPVLVEYYGMTEGGLTIATAEDWLARPGTVGKPAFGMQVLILGPNGERLGPGEQGTIHFLPPGGKMFEYRKAPEKTAAAHTRDGAFTVGDIGYVDEDGYLFISGRTADVIVSSGVNVYPAEIEEALAALPGVRDACVVGGPDDAARRDAGRVRGARSRRAPRCGRGAAGARRDLRRVRGASRGLPAAAPPDRARRAAARPDRQAPAPRAAQRALGRTAGATSPHRPASVVSQEFAALVVGEIKWVRQARKGRKVDRAISTLRPLRSFGRRHVFAPEHFAANFRLTTLNGSPSAACHSSGSTRSRSRRVRAMRHSPSSRTYSSR